VKYCPNCGYKLTEDTSPVPETPQNRLSGESRLENAENEVLEGYLVENSGLAVPKVSDYRERYKNHKLRSGDIRTSAPIVPLKRMDNEMDKFGDLVFGEGLEQEV
jgi:hypothetical protein